MNPPLPPGKYLPEENPTSQFPPPNSHLTMPTFQFLNFYCYELIPNTCTTCIHLYGRDPPLTWCTILRSGPTSRLLHNCHGRDPTVASSTTFTVRTHLSPEWCISSWSGPTSYLLCRFTVGANLSPPTELLRSGHTSFQKNHCMVGTRFFPPVQLLRI